MIALLVVTDGREEYLARTIASLEAQMTSRPEPCILVDDSGNPTYGAMLRETYGDRFGVYLHPDRLGFARTVAHGWRLAELWPAVEYVFHAEDDFTYNQPVDLEHMVSILDSEPTLAQLALKRQPVNADEWAAGDITRLRPDDWQQHPTFTEYTRNFSTNPSLIPRRVFQTCLRYGITMAEMEVTRFLQGLGYTFGYLGDIDDAPRVHHIGDERSPGARYP